MLAHIHIQPCRDTLETLLQSIRYSFIFIFSRAETRWKRMNPKPIKVFIYSYLAVQRHAGNAPARRIRLRIFIFSRAETRWKPEQIVTVCNINIHIQPCRDTLETSFVITLSDSTYSYLAVQRHAGNSKQVMLPGDRYSYLAVQRHAGNETVCLMKPSRYSYLAVQRHAGNTEDVLLSPPTDIHIQPCRDTLETRQFGPVFRLCIFIFSRAETRWKRKLYTIQPILYSYLAVQRHAGNASFQPLLFSRYSYLAVQRHAGNLAYPRIAPLWDIHIQPCRDTLETSRPSP